MKHAYLIRTYWSNRNERADFHRTHRRVANNVVEAIADEVSHNITRMTDGMSEEGFYVAKVRVVRFLGAVIDDDYVSFHTHMGIARDAIHSARCYRSATPPTLGPDMGPWPEPNLQAAEDCIRLARHHRKIAKQYL